MEMMLLESHDGAVSFVSPVVAVIEIVTDERGEDAGSVITAEHAGLLHVQVKVEGPPGSARVRAVLCEVPGVEPQGEGGLVTESQGVVCLSLTDLPPIVPARPEDVGVKETKEVEIFGGEVISVHWTLLANSGQVESQVLLCEFTNWT